jgi:hypothetical protein
MFDLVKIGISFILSGFVGVLVSYYFQRKNTLNQLNFKMAERKAGELKEIRDKFEKISAERIYQTRNMMDSIHVNAVTDKDREHYKESIRNWNNNLNVIYFDLQAQDLHHIALQVESVHARFRSAHYEIDRKINAKISAPASLTAARASVDSAYAESSRVSNLLTQIADLRWSEVKDADTVNLTLANLDKASSLMLLIAIFHKSPSTLRISRSRVDS